eukprot:g1231.t1
MEADDLDIPDELVRDEEDRGLLMEMTELDREVELADRAEKLRRESERLTLIADQQPEHSPSAASEVQTDVDEEKHPSAPGTPMALQSEDKGAESGSEEDIEESDSGDKEAVENEAEFADFLSAQIFRTDLERWLNEPHFEESVLGCYVRFHGDEATKLDRNRNEYLMVEVLECQANEDTTPYSFGPSNKLTKMQLLLKRGSSQFWSGLNVISNAAFTVKEFEDWVQSCKRHNHQLPSKMELEDRKDQIEQARKFVFTHDEVKKILDEKRKQGSLKMSNVMQRAHLMRLRDFSMEQEDYEKVEEYEAQIKELEAKAEAVRRSRSYGSIDKQATAREKQMKAETREALMEKRRTRVIEKFKRKLEKLPTERQPMALLKFYGPSHPLCINIQERDVKRPFLSRTPSPEFQPSLPEGIINIPDLERDLNNPSFYECMTVQGRKMDSKQGEKLLSGFLSEQSESKTRDRQFGEWFLQGWSGMIESWEADIQSRINCGEINVIHYPK